MKTYNERVETGLIEKPQRTDYKAFIGSLSKRGVVDLMH